MLSDLIPAEGRVTAGSQPHCPLSPQKWDFAVWAQAPPLELLMDPFLVLIRLQLEFLQGDFAILVAVLVLEHVPYGFLWVLPRHEASFALSNLSLDEGGELGAWRGKGRVGVRVALARNPRGRPASEGREETASAGVLSRTRAVAGEMGHVSAGRDGRDPEPKAP